MNAATRPAARCATKDCARPPVHRLETGDVHSTYCARCALRIVTIVRSMEPREALKRQPWGPV